MNFILDIEKQIKDFLKHVNGSQVISATESKRVKPRGSRFGRLYRLSNISKSLVKNYRTFWCIFSVIKTPPYNITKNLLPISELIITNKLSIKKSFDFAREIVEQDLGFFMDSLDVESFFTNVPLKEAISISCASPISNEAKINTLS